MLAHLLAEMRSSREKMDANQAKADANLKEITASMKNQELLVRMEANQEKIMAMLNAYHEKMACQETMEACLECKEPSPKERESEAERQEVPMEEATVKSSRIIKKWHRGPHLCAGRHVKPKKLTQGDCGSRGMLAAACRKVSHHATVAWRKRNLSRKIQTQVNRWNEDKLLYRSRTAQRMRDPEVTKERDKTVEGRRRQQWHEEKRCYGAPTSKEREESRQ
jgi:hypothetical protein